MSENDGNDDWLEQIRREADALGEGEAPVESGGAEAGGEKGEPEPRDWSGAGDEGGELEPRDRSDAGGAGGEPEASFELGPPEELPEAELPDWLERMRETQTGELRAQAAAEPSPASLLPQGTGRLDDAAVQARLGPAMPTGEQPGEPFEPAEEPGELPDWLQDVSPEPAAEAAALPRVPALIGEPADAAQPPAEAAGLPDWLGEIDSLKESLEEEMRGPAAAPGSELTPATLPTWLEAMRPVETFRSVVQIEAEEDQSVESVGPLAGLRGVLLAEPVVAMPRTSTVGSMQLEVTERQYAQAELLQKMVEEEQREQAAVPRRRVRPAFIRWGISALVLLAMALPVFGGAPAFALPRLAPQELGALVQIVDGLPVDRPALLVFDYEPGNSGELDAVAGAFFDQLMARGVPLATLTTRPAGPALAKRALDERIAGFGYVPGQNLIHLGYLSGGPTAVQLFSLNPRAAILGGFDLPEGVPADLWSTTLLQGVQTLADFSAVAVISSGTESARIWAEQAGNRIGDTPLVMVLSAGAEPVIRPYFEDQAAGARQVDGILSGLPAAASYEQRNGRAGLALARWNPFGSGILAAELILLAGAGYGLANWWLGRRET